MINNKQITKGSEVLINAVWFTVVDIDETTLEDLIIWVIDQDGEETAFRLGDIEQVK